MAEGKEWPELARGDDPFMGSSHGYRYQGAYYALLWSDYPRREETPVVYRWNEDRTEGSLVRDEALRQAVAAVWWEETDFRIRNIGWDGPAPSPRPAPTVVPSQMSGMAMAMFRMAGGQNPLLPGAWVCPGCGKTDNTGRFCTECGGKRPD